MRNKSFTLIELLVVIAVIGLLASIVIVNLRGTKNKANIARGLQFSQSIHHILGSEAVGIWNFNEGAGTTAYDSSGFGNNGTINGASYTTDTPSGQSYALSFDGVDDYVDCGNHASLNITGNEITISLWVKLETTGAFNAIISKSNISGYTEGFKIYKRDYDTALSSRISTDGQDNIHILYGFQTGIWQHIVFTYNGSRIIGYINGVEGNSIRATGNISPSSAPVLIGKAVGLSNANGTIDDVHIYNQALSHVEIQKLYAEGRKKHELALYEK